MTSTLTTLLLVLLTACAGCERASPQVAPPPAEPPPGPPPQRAPGALPGSREYACPGIEKLKTTGASECTAMGCMDGFSLTLYPNGGWPHGDYRFVIKHDATTTTCEGRLPLKGCDQQNVVCDGEGAGPGESGCALPPDQHSFSNIGFDGYPAVVDIDVLRDGVPLTHAHYDVAYTMGLANGEGCEPACCSATGALTLPKPK